MSVLYDVSDNIAVITIDRQEALNALNADVLAGLEQALSRAQNDPDVYVLVITGAGRAFVAGADIAQMKDFTPQKALAFGAYGNAVFSKIEELEKPVIAAVNGFALGGGCELALACDIRLASEKAKFGQPETGLGITPGFGGTQRLPRVVGLSKAKEMIFTAQNIDAQEALRCGLVSNVLPADQLMGAAMDMAGKIAKNAQIAVRHAKSAIRNGMQADIRTGTGHEAQAFALCFATDDQKNAMEAFVNKEKPGAFKNI